MPADEAAVRSATAHLLEQIGPSTPFVERRRLQYEAGLAWVAFPRGLGGLDADASLQEVVDDMLAASGIADDSFYRNGVALNLVAPALVHFGTPDQQRHLLPIFTCEEVWCQLFSEPGAGSDLAGVATSAVRDGDVWVVNGQKVWTTLAHRADFGLLLARTDPDVPKHRGLTCFMVDMRAPGVDVRGLREMTGEVEFNEVFMTDVVVPDTARIGDAGAGWGVALSMLSQERGSTFTLLGKGPGPVSVLVKAWQDAGRPHGAVLDTIAQRWIEWEVLRWTNDRSVASGMSAGPLGSISKLMFATFTQRTYDTAMRVLGAHGMLHEHGYDLVRREDMSTMTGDEISKMFMRSRALSIEGGTSEIMRNTLAERVLGLPPEPRVDKDVPWSQVPRS